MTKLNVQVIEGINKSLVTEILVMVQKNTHFTRPTANLTTPLTSCFTSFLWFDADNKVFFTKCFSRNEEERKAVDKFVILNNCITKIEEVKT